MNQPTLTRKNHKVAESMQRYLSAIDNNLYAAEQVCHQESKGKRQCAFCYINTSCPLATRFPFFNKILMMRGAIGEHVVQDDPTTDAYDRPCWWRVGGSDGLPLCLHDGKKDCPDMVRVGEERRCGRKMA